MMIYKQSYRQANESWLQYLLYNNLPIDTIDYQGLTALQKAVINGDVDLVYDLLGYGADVNFHDFNGYSIFSVAVMENQIEIMKVLGCRGALLDCPRFSEYELEQIASPNKNSLEVIKTIRQPRAELLWAALPQNNK